MCISTNRLIGIFGNSGFIGSSLIASLPSCIGISYRENDWKSKVINCESVINLIGKAHDHSGNFTKEDFFNVNVEISKDIFKNFINSEAKLFVHISSISAIEEYESNKELKENDICSPESWYGKSKREAERWLLSQPLPNDKKIIIIRPPMVHGAGDKGNLKLLYKLISRGIPYPLSSFENKRSFISIDNFCFYIQQIIQNPDKLESGIYHIADEEPISTIEIINIIKKVTNKNVPNIVLPKGLVKAIARFGDRLSIPLNSKRLKKLTSNLLVSNEKIKKALNIEELPLTAKEGLEKTINSFLNNK